jgi:hypothetical protein
MARRGCRQRDPLREKFWRRTIREQQRSELTVRAFCLWLGLFSYHRLRGWVAIGRRGLLTRPRPPYRGARQKFEHFRRRGRSVKAAMPPCSPSPWRSSWGALSVFLTPGGARGESATGPRMRSARPVMAARSTVRMSSSVLNSGLDSGRARANGRPQPSGRETWVQRRERLRSITSRRAARRPDRPSPIRDATDDVRSGEALGGGSGRLALPASDPSAATIKPRWSAATPSRGILRATERIDSWPNPLTGNGLRPRARAESWKWPGRWNAGSTSRRPATTWCCVGGPAPSPPGASRRSI